MACSKETRYSSVSVSNLFLRLDLFKYHILRGQIFYFTLVCLYIFDDDKAESITEADLKQLMDVIHYATDAGDHVVGNARLSWYATKLYFTKMDFRPLTDSNQQLLMTFFFFYS